MNARISAARERHPSAAMAERHPRRTRRGTGHGTCIGGVVDFVAFTFQAWGSTAKALTPHGGRSR